jgi:hypothetical protein
MPDILAIFDAPQMTVFIVRPLQIMIIHPTPSIRNVRSSVRFVRSVRLLVLPLAIAIFDA